MTHHALGVIADAGGRITYGQLHKRLVPALREAQYDQEPQLEGRDRVQAPPDLHLMPASRSGVRDPRRLQPRAGGGGRAAADGSCRCRSPRSTPIGSASAIHEEGTGLAFRQDVDVPPATEARLLALVADLHRWSTGLGLTQAQARAATDRLGRTLHRTFLGRRGGALLASLQPDGGAARRRRVGARPAVGGDAVGRRRAGARRPVRPHRHDDHDAGGPAGPDDRRPDGEDPRRRQPDRRPGGDGRRARRAAPPGRRAGRRAGRARRPRGPAASRRGLAAAVRGRDHDIVHFAGHARFDAGDPHDSSLLLADGELTADHVGRLAWASPPYLVFNSACQSARVAQGRALVAAGGRANGLPAAFLAAGCEAYVGHFWPVGDVAAAEFAGCFYETLFRDVNAGAAVLDARRAVRGRFDESADLAAFGAVFFGDAGNARTTAGATWPRRCDVAGRTDRPHRHGRHVRRRPARRHRRRRVHRRRRHHRRRPAEPSTGAGRVRRCPPGGHRRRDHPGSDRPPQPPRLQHLPLWSAPRDTPYTSRHQWPGAATYGRDISNPAQAIGVAAAAAALRYAEVKAAAGGVTAIQGSPPLTRAFPGWMVRNIEKEQVAAHGDDQLIFQAVIKADVTKLRSFAPRLAGGASFIYHLAEGTAPALLGEYADLRTAGCVHPNLIGIHSTALGADRVRRLGRPGAGTIVWSPFSNIWLYGDTTDVLEARRHGILVCLGSDWAPSGTKNLLGELKVAALWNDEALAGALDARAARDDGDGQRRRRPAPLLGRRRRPAAGRRAGRRARDDATDRAPATDPHDNLLRVDERSVRLVVVGGRPVLGTPSLLAAAGATDVEPLSVGGVRKGVVMRLPDELLPADPALHAEANLSWADGRAALQAVVDDPAAAVRAAWAARQRAAARRARPARVRARHARPRRHRGRPGADRRRARPARRAPGPVAGPRRRLVRRRRHRQAPRRPPPPPARPLLTRTSSGRPIGRPRAAVSGGRGGRRW